MAEFVNLLNDEVVDDCLVIDYCFMSGHKALIKEGKYGCLKFVINLLCPIIKYME